jgi:ABC-type sugar transport system substrate-binding protein
MRRTSFNTWLLLAVVAGAVLASRFGRALGPTAIVLAVVLVVAGAFVLRGVVEVARARAAARDTLRPTTKNVTPHEPALPPGAAPSIGSTAVSGPSVIVVEPPDSSERLAAKLQALEGLRADGLVTDEEYEAKRASLIADF